MSDPDLDDLQGCGCFVVFVIIVGTFVLCSLGVCWKLVAWCWS